MNTRRAFTLVEIMIVVAIIGLLAAIAIPSFIKARQASQTNACINNLRQIDAAKEQWALNSGAVNGDTVTPGGIDGVDSYIKNGEPQCPLGDGSGDYTYDVVGLDPRCTFYHATNHNAELSPAVP